MSDQEPRWLFQRQAAKKRRPKSEWQYERSDDRWRARIVKNIVPSTIPDAWKFVEKRHPGAYAAWVRGPNLDGLTTLGVTGPQSRFAVAYIGRDGWYRDKLGDNEWHVRDGNSPCNPPIATPAAQGGEE